MKDTIEIYTLWERVKKRFSIVRSQPKSFNLLDTVQPITSMDFITTSFHMERLVETTAGVQFLYFVAVPTGKRWLIHSMGFSRQNGTATFNHIFVRPDASASPIVLEHYDVSQTRVHWYLPHALPLYAGNELGIKIDTVPGAESVYWLYLVYSEMEIEE